MSNLPPLLLARLKKRGFNINVPATKDECEDEEIIAENYDDVEPESELKQNQETSYEGRVEPSATNEDNNNYIADKFKGYPGCPNKSNVWHECTSFCKDHWGGGKRKPNRKYLHYKKKLLNDYPLPENWLEIYDPGCGRYYYWNENNDKVSWLPPTYPKAEVTFSAAYVREQRYLNVPTEGDDSESSSNDSANDSDVESEKKKTKVFKRPNQVQQKNHVKYGRDRERRETERNRNRVKAKQNDLDPMDPASYSDIPRGKWSDGLASGMDAKTGVDSTASGPLFQMRPYPSPGAVLRAQQKK